jgi:hypothetical protein
VALAYLLSGSIDPEDRRRHELDLVALYAVQLEVPEQHRHLPCGVMGTRIVISTWHHGVRPQADTGHRPRE